MGSPCSRVTCPTHAFHFGAHSPGPVPLSLSLSLSLSRVLLRPPIVLYLALHLSDTCFSRWFFACPADRPFSSAQFSLGEGKRGRVSGSCDTSSSSPPPPPSPYLSSYPSPSFADAARSRSPTDRPPISRLQTDRRGGPFLISSFVRSLAV